MKTAAKKGLYLANIKGSDTQILHPVQRMTLIQRKMARIEFLYILFIKKKWITKIFFFGEKNDFEKIDLKKIYFFPNLKFLY